MMKNPEKKYDKETKKEIDDEYNLAKGYWKKGNRIEALMLTEKTISDQGKNESSCYVHHELQGDIFYQLAEETEITNDIKRVYLFASLDAFSMFTLPCHDALKSFRGCVLSLIQLGDQLGIKKFYRKAASKAYQALSVTNSSEKYTALNKEFDGWYGYAEEKKKEKNSNAVVTVSETSTMANQMVLKKKNPFQQLKFFWVNLDDKTKRDFLVVDFRKLIEYIQNEYGKEVKRYFRKCVISLISLHWRYWKCHICSQVNYCFTDCKMHILDKHVHKYEPEFSDRPKYVDEILADMICCGDWKPVDIAQAANLINDRIKSQKEFVYVNGWCSDWPVAGDEKRETILKQFSEVLKASCPRENCTLSCTLWDWLIDYTEEHLDLPGVSGSYLDKCSFFKNPQCICFLDLKHLKHILKKFSQLTTDVRESLVSKVVNQLWENSLVKERLDLEGHTNSNLLLDKRLLCEEELELDQNETVEHYESTGIYEDVMPKGDKIVSWILDCPKIDKEFMSQMAKVAKGLHNREIWLAVLRIVQGLVRKKESYYDKRRKMLSYEKMLCEVETICDREDTRKNVNQRSTYEFALRTECEKLVGKQDDNRKYFWTVVKDVFVKLCPPVFGVLEDMECISKLSATVSNDEVKKSMLRLRKSLKEMFLLIDSKILRNECTYKKLIDVFPKLSVVEYRLVVLPLVKKFLQDKLKKMMETNSNSVAAGDSVNMQG
ncbi:ubiquitin carboxyl-terminal hydrolase-like protein, putative (DUF627 and DUF629) [Arabidopsis thaliana]|uniref:Ubiquitin carboxyl-terminal hydrolase-like protein, putative (DUF627 and DUF629) n=1 Tax=Arabidopsis thaliana TaxID=3702 RepID=O80772_ARATH|nr:ubiquitin carboxyl-terminal hydrolase-like protein, putative (DUF627 and DUF629) [Arabidopsis thaliana]AAC27399.1 hypothetical protein [Arabidopsis thaliana]AEC08939.1 ubiquitin carboxyl-terminal hydrolase-like protein, putative (DUF627 and DUF629) [Arabidopsis thaliana]|eukprot:NP_180970.1 ubiquitin carboxyl-terminal hydrolase-like protein, putative (DUF627 and DUF629) [Arabidopsis thaliana]